MLSSPLKRLLALSGGIKGILAHAADGADPIIGNILKGSAGSDTAIGIAKLGVVNVTANALVFHGELNFLSQVSRFVGQEQDARV